MKSLLLKPHEVIAINNGTKVQHRVMANQPEQIQRSMPDWDESKMVLRYEQHMDDDEDTKPHGPDWILTTDEEEWTVLHVFKPKYQVGDVIFGKEAFTQNGWQYYRYKADFAHPENMLFTNPSVPDKFRGKWVSALHMPQSAARIFLKITAVRVARVKEISHADAKAEGVIAQPHRCPGFNPALHTERELPHCPNENSGIHDCHRCAYVFQWKKDHGAESWDKDFVFVYEFEKIEKP